MKMRPAWTCSSIGTSVLVADSLIEREKSLGQDSGVTDKDIFLPPSRLSGSKTASHEHPYLGVHCLRHSALERAHY